MNPGIIRDDNCYILYDADRIAHPDDIPFDHREAEAPEPIVGAGRGGAWRVRVNDVVAALRPYRRGGMVRHLIRSAYLWTGIERTRAFREFRLMHALHQEGLPVPRPLAARVVRTAFWYRAELLTEWLHGVHSLVSVLGTAEVPDDTWRRIGATLKAFHRAGVWHADLNAHNVLLDGTGRPFIIDFDRGSRSAPSRRRARSNLARLKRSLEKVHATGRALYYSRAGWRALLEGYNAA